MAKAGKPFTSSNKPAVSAAPAAAPIAAASKPVARTEVRNSPIPKVAAAKPAVAAKVVTHDQIAVRAYEIWASGQGGSDFDNWTRAERELRRI